MCHRAYAGLHRFLQCFLATALAKPRFCRCLRPLSLPGGWRRPFLPSIFCFIFFATCCACFIFLKSCRVELWLKETLTLRRAVFSHLPISRVSCSCQAVSYVALQKPRLEKHLCRYQICSLSAFSPGASSLVAVAQMSSRFLRKHRPVWSFSFCLFLIQALLPDRERSEKNRSERNSYIA